jgi:hypothetical protein
MLMMKILELCKLYKKDCNKKYVNDENSGIM